YSRRLRIYISVAYTIEFYNGDPGGYSAFQPRPDGFALSRRLEQYGPRAARVGRILAEVSGLCWSRVPRERGLHGPRQLGHRPPGWGGVSLPAAVGDRAIE